MLAAWLDDDDDDDDDIKAKTDKTSQNTKCKLCVDGEEKFNFIIRKWQYIYIYIYTQEAESFLENETHKINETDIQMDYLTLSKRSVLIRQKKNNLSSRGFCLK